MSLGQSKIKIILQQLLEMLLVAAVAFVISLGTGKMVSNLVGNMLEAGTNDNHVQMEIPAVDQETAIVIWIKEQKFQSLEEECLMMLLAGRRIRN